MSFFDNLKVVTNSISKTASNITTNIATSSVEQANLARIKKELNVINTEIDSACTQIGKKFLEYVIQTKEMPGIDVSDILKVIDPKLTRKVELEAEAVEIEKRLKNQKIKKLLNK